ncbi:hypothetical protein EJB05_06020, partial [Eragrostis curvula]
LIQFLNLLPHSSPSRSRFLRSRLQSCLFDPPRSVIAILPTILRRRRRRWRGLLLRPSAFVTDLDGGIIILPASDALEITRRRDRVAKRARDGGVAMREEADARGWSSAVLERSLALRRRRGPASCSRRGCGWVVGADPAAAAEADEHGCPREVAATQGSGALVGGAAAEETGTDESSYDIDLASAASLCSVSSAPTPPSTLRCATPRSVRDTLPVENDVLMITCILTNCDVPLLWHNAFARFLLCLPASLLLLHIFCSHSSMNPEMCDSKLAREQVRRKKVAETAMYEAE